jgi:hypothetical protein
MPIGPVHWGVYEGALLERLMSIMLLREHGVARRRTPSRGDGGVDVCAPRDNGYHVFQIKGFAGRVNSSRKQQVKKWSVPWIARSGYLNLGY